MRDQVALSKRMAHALRHDPAAYGLTLDAEGWTSVTSLLSAPAFADVERAAVEDVVTNGTKRRFVLDGDWIRAVYGHSVEGRIVIARATPPSGLFHGTTRAAWTAIAEQGLLPSGRQYVHLSAEPATAKAVAARRTGPWALLHVDAAGAARDGVTFYRADDGLWLADAVPPAHLQERDWEFHDRVADARG